MVQAFVYLGKRFFYRILDFLRHWYVKSMRMYWNYVINKLERLDLVLAWKITLKNLFQPLYRDFSIIGRVLGFIFRASRLLVGGFVYIVVFFVAIGIYVVWIGIPAYLVARILFG